MTGRSRLSKQKERDRKRKSKHLKQKSLIWVVTEGEKTEVEYVEWVSSQLPGDHILLKPTNPHASDPGSLCSYAKSLVSLDDKSAFVWIMSDVDDYQNTLRALCPVSQAERVSGKVRWAISNPSIDAWLVMHIRNVTNQYCERDVFRQIGKNAGLLTGPNSKSINTEFLKGNSRQACVNANSLHKQHESGGTLFPENNPCSDIPLFLKFVVDIHNQACRDSGALEHQVLSWEEIY